MNRWGYKMAEFMRGRYGSDQFGMFLFIVSLACQIFGNLFGLRIVYWIGTGMFIFMLFRTFSRNIHRRQKENQKFMEIKNRLFNWNYFRKQKKEGTYTYNKKEREKNGKKGIVYCYFYCPNCKQQIRIPAGKGKVKVTCPKCQTKFEVNT